MKARPLGQRSKAWPFVRLPAACPAMMEEEAGRCAPKIRAAGGTGFKKKLIVYIYNITIYRILMKYIT